MIKLHGKNKNYTSFYRENLISYVLKKVSKPISLTLSIVFNKTLWTSIYPSAYEKCFVFPLFKGGDKAYSGNYKPIS